MKVVTNARGIPFIVAYEPLFVFPTTVAEAAARAASELIEGICKETDIPFIDLGEDFAGRRDELVIPNDGHWTAEGHRVVAATLRRSPIFQSALRGDRELHQRPPG